jgi:hypothetical protein
LERRLGANRQRIGNYRSIVTAFLNVAETTEPSSAARAQRVEEIAHHHEQSYIDQALLRRLAELVMSLRDQRG